MSFWVAKNRQKAPEQNAFAERARRKRTRNPNPEPETASEPVSEPQAVPEPADVAESMPEPADVAESMPEPADVAESMPDLQALREAAEKAAALIHADEPEPEPEAEPEASRRGRKPDPAVTERTAKVLAEVQKAGASGISKPKLAEVLEEKEQQVYTSLRALQKDGKVESKSLEGLGYRWVAL